ncbi:hypothetical protein Tco_1563829 [Tanacetum coccineum]
MLAWPFVYLGLRVENLEGGPLGLRIHRLFNVTRHADPREKLCSSNHNLADPISVELNMWHHVGMAHHSTLAAVWKILRWSSGSPDPSYVLTLLVMQILLGNLKLQILRVNGLVNTVVLVGLLRRDGPDSPRLSLEKTLGLWEGFSSGMKPGGPSVVCLLLFLAIFRTTESAGVGACSTDLLIIGDEFLGT